MCLIHCSPSTSALAVGTSGLLFHLSNQIVKSSTPDVGEILKSNPEVRRGDYTGRRREEEVFIVAQRVTFCPRPPSFVRS